MKYWWLILLLCFGCQTENEKKFRLMTSAVTGIDFSNDVAYTPEFNMYTYRNFYNGAGVGISDINNDGLSDIFFCGNLVDNKLYLNKGDFQFEDITDSAGVSSSNVWSTGVSFVDINSDGWLDIYVCKSGRPGGAQRHNELFINNGDLTFTEDAASYGLDDIGLSSHAAFFDYDKDGDLDCYLLNNSFRNVGGYDMQPGLREIRDSLGGNKLYRNNADAGQLMFTDVSAEAGIYGSAIGFGLGVTIGDINGDGWTDIFVSNDFFEHDYLYINRHDGTFHEELKQRIRETSMGSMGADLADVNNDGYPELMVTEMLPRTEARLKTKMTFEDWPKYQLAVEMGYHHQFTRNVLQLNHRNGHFSDISRLAGVHATDWSWSALLADLDNDGWKDIFVSNGIFKDLLDQDYINFHSNDPTIIEAIKRKEPDAILKLIDRIPSERIPNEVFRNRGDLTFEPVNEQWGLSLPSHSNGAAYGDLDNDGDLDLVINNCNMPAFVYQNNGSDTNHYLQIELKGQGTNLMAIGSQVFATLDSATLHQQLAPQRGFQSNVDHRLHFGLGKNTAVDRLMVVWPNLDTTTLENIDVDQVLRIEQPAGAISPRRVDRQAETTLFDQTNLDGLAYKHQESSFNDFDRDRLLMQMYSAEGPCIAVADVNGDGLVDLFLGGAHKQSASLWIQDANRSFELSPQADFRKNAHSEDIDALFFDANNDGHADLYVASGSNEFSGIDISLADHLYLNDGFGNFVEASRALPRGMRLFTSSVASGDLDGDGDQDLVLGNRMKPAVYGVPVSSAILINDGHGTFSPATEKICPQLSDVGMITDLALGDTDNDGDLDLMLMGEWMEVFHFINENGRLTKSSEPIAPAGLWTNLLASDLDGDGDLDAVLGNHGLNSRLVADANRPMTMLTNDFDQNRTAEQIISITQNNKSYPIALRHDLVMQLPDLKKKYLYYEDYKLQAVEDIFTEKQMRTSARAHVVELRSCIAWNTGNGFELEVMPHLAQISSIYAILALPRKKGGADLILAGNNYRIKPELGIQAGSYGTVLRFVNSRYQVLPQDQSGLDLIGAIRGAAHIEISEDSYLLFATNNDQLQVYKKR